jgi:2',5'-phosphodiesterase
VCRASAGAIELLSTGRVPADHWDWQFGVAFRWDKDEEDGGDGGAGAGEGGELSKMVHTEVEAAAPAPPRAGASGPVPGVPLASPFDLVAADGLASAFTNHVRGYQGLLDYVWLEAGALEVRRLVPLPSEEELGGYLPSRRFPSDHLAVVCELRVKRTHTGRLAAASPEGGGGGDSGGGGEGEAECGGGSVSRGGGGGEDGGDAAGGGAVLPAAMHNVGVAARLLRRGGVIAAPTDTLYGLAACAADGAAIARLYAAKGRPGSKPLAVCVADHADVARYVHVDHLPPGLLEGLLPGAVTLLLARRADAPLSPALNPGVAALGVRIPAAAFLRAAARQHRGALALTSANPSGAPSSVAAGEFRALWPRCDAVFDGGALGAGREGSTVVDLSVAGRFRVARRGAELEATLRALRETYGLTELQEGEGEAR